MSRGAGGAFVVFSSEPFFCHAFFLHCKCVTKYFFFRHDIVHSTCNLLRSGASAKCRSIVRSPLITNPFIFVVSQKLFVHILFTSNFFFCFTLLDLIP